MAGSSAILTGEAAAMAEPTCKHKRTQVIAKDTPTMSNASTVAKFWKSAKLKFPALKTNHSLMPSL